MIARDATAPKTNTHMFEGTTHSEKRTTFKYERTCTSSTLARARSNKAITLNAHARAARSATGVDHISIGRVCRFVVLYGARVARTKFSPTSRATVSFEIKYPAHITHAARDAGKRREVVSDLCHLKQ